MRKRKAAAAKQRTPAVNPRGRTKSGNKGETTTTTRMRTEGRGGGRQAAAAARAARTGPGNCETRKKSSAATTTATTTSQRILPGAAGRRAATATTTEGTGEAAGVAVPLRHRATAAATIQRLGLRVEVEATEAPIPAMPATANEICAPDATLTPACLLCMYSSNHGTVILSLSLTLALSWAVVSC